MDESSCFLALALLFIYLFVTTGCALIRLLRYLKAHAVMVECLSFTLMSVVVVIATRCCVRSQSIMIIMMMISQKNYLSLNDNNGKKKENNTR